MRTKTKPSGLFNSLALGLLAVMDKHADEIVIALLKNLDDLLIWAMWQAIKVDLCKYLFLVFRRCNASCSTTTTSCGFGSRRSCWTALSRCSFRFLCRRSSRLLARRSRGLCGRLGCHDSQCARRPVASELIAQAQKCVRETGKRLAGAAQRAASTRGPKSD